jgi:hypothetical protein
MAIYVDVIQSATIGNSFLLTVLYRSGTACPMIVITVILCIHLDPKSAQLTLINF